MPLPLPRRLRGTMAAVGDGSPEQEPAAGACVALGNDELRLVFAALLTTRNCEKDVGRCVYDCYAACDGAARRGAARARLCKTARAPKAAVSWTRAGNARRSRDAALHLPRAFTGACVCAKSGPKCW